MGTGILRAYWKNHDKVMKKRRKEIALEDMCKKKDHELKEFFGDGDDNQSS